MDLGCYIVHWFRTIAREEPVVATATATEGPRGVDVAMRAVLQFPSGMALLCNARWRPPLPHFSKVVASAWRATQVRSTFKTRWPPVR